MLSSVASSLRNSVVQPHSMTAEQDVGAPQFEEASLSNDDNLVAPHGNMVAKRMANGVGFRLFHEDCPLLRFAKDSNSQMNVAFAHNAVSVATARVLRTAIDDPDITLGTFRHNKVYDASLVIFIEKWNRRVDILNGRTECYSPANGWASQEELLTTLAWLTRWNNNHDDRVENGSATEFNVFAPEA